MCLHDAMIYRIFLRRCRFRWYYARCRRFVFCCQTPILDEIAETALRHDTHSLGNRRYFGRGAIRQHSYCDILGHCYNDPYRVCAFDRHYVATEKHVVIPEYVLPDDNVTRVDTEI